MRKIGNENITVLRTAKNKPMISDYCNECNSKRDRSDTE